MENLPKDLFSEVLLRLSHKSLSLCSCVSKSWRTTAQDPLFVKAHTARWGRLHDREPTDLLIVVLNDRNGYILSLDSVRDQQSEEDGPIMLKTTPIETTTFRYWNNIAASCNGLLCIQDLVEDYDLHVWDQACGGEPLALPVDPQQHRFRPVMIGIGYDDTTSTKKYKFLRVGVEQPADVLDLAYVTFPVRDCHVCDIAMDGTVGPWRRIGEFSNDYDARLLGVSWNGGIHWLFYKRGRLNKSCPEVASFCVKEEKFELCKGPDCLEEYSRDRIYRMAVLGGRLSFIEYSLTDLRMDIWMVKDDFGWDENKYSWTKEYVIPFDRHPTIKHIRNLMVMCLWKNDEILIKEGWTGLVSYDTKKGTFQDVEIDGLHGKPFFGVYPFYRSLMLKKACANCQLIINDGNFNQISLTIPWRVG